MESKLIDTFTIREFVAGSEDEQSIRAELNDRIKKISFLTAELAPCEYLCDSDGIIATLAEKAGVYATTLPTYRSYVDVAFKRQQALYVENINLKKQVVGQRN